ncbi:MAG: hypothetical protein PHS99_03840 [Candidatus Marinimicrobia bacterium]|nr:hypothetical protein [Candidatus Neomarinimicrobiota bacterium]
MKKTFIFCILLVTYVYGALPNVASIDVIEPDIQGAFYYPKFSPDGTRLLMTKEQFVGLWEFDLRTGQTLLISNAPGAGYEPVYSKDRDRIYYLQDTFEKGRRYRSLMEYHRNTKGSQVLIEKERLLTHPLQVTDHGVITRTQSKVLLVGKDTKSENPQTRFVHTFENRLTLYENGKERELYPSGRGNYVWASLSPTGDKILYHKAGEGTFICDLQENILAEFGYANAPVWSPNGQWIAYMKDYDDGHFITESEIWISSVDGKESAPLTNTKDIIEMYPQWSPDSKALTFHDLSGHIYIMKLHVTE